MNQESLDNKAKLLDNRIIEHAECEECNEEYLFALKDSYHEFSIGLTTIISCIAFAEKEGVVPELPEEWWYKIRSRY